MSEKRDCIICTNESGLRLTKGTTKYYQCSNCKTIFCDALDNDNLVGGEFEPERNEKENHLRIDRIGEIVNGIDKEKVNILDFGCGHGLLIDDLRKAGYITVDGYDAYYEPYSKLPKKEFYHVVSMVECIEHTTPPFLELDVIHRSLVNGGGLMIETSFVNIAEQEGIPIDDFFYIAPQSGHSTIFSHHGLDMLLLMKGFTPMHHFNRHVRLYKKI